MYLAFFLVFSSTTFLFFVADRAYAFQVQAETIHDIIYDPNGFGGIPHVYSDGTTVKYLSDASNPPSDARWVSFMPHDLDEGIELYFSRDGITTEKQFMIVDYWSELPADVKWLTVSNFDGGFGDNEPIHNQEYRYSVDGITIQSGTEVPANALWATLSYYTTTWGNNPKTLNYSRSYTTYPLEVDPIRTVTIHSDAADPNYAKVGDKVTLSFTSLLSLQTPTVTLAGQAVLALPDASGKQWSASVILSPVVSEGEIPFSIVYKDTTGDSQGTVTASTDGSSVIFDKTPPAITLIPSTSDWTKNDIVVTGHAADAGSGIDIQKWAEGDRDANYFHRAGQDAVEDTFTATSNGWYTWYAKDRAGNESVEKMEIRNIDRMPPTLTLDYAPKDWTSEAVQISADAADEPSGIHLLKWVSGVQEEAYFQNGGGSAFRDGFVITENGTYTIYAEDRAGNGVAKQITISNLDFIPPAITLSSSPTTPTKDDITVTADISDRESDVAVRKWAAGEHDAAYFTKAGTILNEASFMAAENGIYTVYAKDHAGNESIETMIISNIFKTSSSVSLSLDTSGWTSEPIRVQAHITDNGSAIAEQKWAAGEQDISYFLNAGTPLVGTYFTVHDNGIYTVYIKDNSGHEAIASIEVTTIDYEKPTIEEPTLSPNSWTNGEITVAVSAQDNSGVISVYKWSGEEKDEAFFQNGGGTAFSDSFTVDNNGAYTIYVEDAAGNGTVKTFDVTTIDKGLPVIQLRASNERPTNQNVTVTADVYSASPIVIQKWAPGDQTLSYFETHGTDFSNLFEVELNGWYTVYAENSAGNKQVEAIQITNIVKDVPVIQLHASPAIPTQSNVTVTASVYSHSPLTDRKLAFGQHDAAYFQIEGSPWNDQLEVPENGWVSYYVKDQAGNVTVKQLEITNIDRQKPVITLLGQATITVAQHSSFTDPGAAAVDNMDGDLTAQIMVTGEVDTSKPGEYSLSYSVSDRAGNEAEQVVRTVIVTQRQIDPPDPPPGGGVDQPDPDQPDPDQPDPDQSDPDQPDPDQPGSNQPGSNRPGPSQPEPNRSGQTQPDRTKPNQEKPNQEKPGLTDISGHWAEAEITSLYKMKLIEGYPDGTFKPDQPVTRAEFITLLVRSLNLEAEPLRITFEDAAYHWASETISTAFAHGLVEGYSNHFFGPEDPITREQMAVMLARAGRLTGIFANASSTGTLPFHDRSSIADWAQESTAAVVENELMDGHPGHLFIPKGTATRAEVATVIFRMLELLNQEQ